MGSHIIIDEWKKKYPNKCAIVLLDKDSDGKEGELIAQSAARAREQMQNHKDAMFGDDENYILI